MLEFYEAIARLGMACIFLIHAVVHPLDRTHPRITRINDDNFISGLTALAEVIHRHDCSVFA
jgi:2,4-dienoyl-CoA reductase-like NADH-dependent reductase (Old Yellow Enzyme family)